MLDQFPELAVVVVATALVLVGALELSRRLGICSAFDLAVATPIVSATQVVLTLIVAGLVHRLDRTTIIALNALITLPLASLALRHSGATAPFVLAHSALRALRRDVVAAALVVVAGLSLLWRVLLAIALPPYGYDAVSYHLPTVIEWLQQGRIVNSPFNTCCAYYPANGELLAAWPTVLTHDLYLADVAQCAFAVVGAVALAGIARICGLPGTGQAIAGSLFVLTPAVLTQANTAYVDVTFVATLLSAYYLILRGLESRGREARALFLLAGGSAGLCLGTKPTGILGVGALLVAVFLWAGLRGRRSVGGQAVLVCVGLLLVPTLLLGSWWYARAWVATGNPLFPARVEILGARLFDGIEAVNAPPRDLRGYSPLVQPLVSWSRDIHFWTNKGYSYDQRVGGLGPVWAYLGALLVIPFGVAMWRRRPLVVLYFLVPVLATVAVLPYRWWPRFTLQLAAVGAIAVAWALGRVPRGRARAALGLAVVCLAIAGAALASERVSPGVSAEPLTAIDVLGSSLVHPMADGALSGEDYRWLDDVHGSAVIATEARSVHVTSPLAGMRLQRRLVPLPRQGDLIRFLRANGVDYVFVRRGTSADRRERARPSDLASIGEGLRLRAYRVLSG